MFGTPGPGGRPTAASSFSLSNDGPSGELMFNFNNPATHARFHSTSVITYYLTPTPSGPRVDFTIVGQLNNAPGYIVVGQAVDGGPAGSGLDTVSITVRTPTGELVHSSSGPVIEGDVVIVP